MNDLESAVARLNKALAEAPKKTHEARVDWPPKADEIREAVREALHAAGSRMCPPPGESLSPGGCNRQDCAFCWKRYIDRLLKGGD